MMVLANFSLENEMDQILAYKKSIRIGELLGLSISTQTTFATAVSEVSREVIDKAKNAIAEIGTATEGDRFSLFARITCTAEQQMVSNNEGFEYARKLVPVLDISIAKDALVAVLKLAIPRANKLNAQKISMIKLQIENEGPSSAYEEIKLRNAQLSHLNQQQQLNLEQAIMLDQKKSDFLSLAGHEINTPLTVLHSYLQIALQTGKADPEARDRYLSKAIYQSAKLTKIVQQLLDLTKIEQGQLNYTKSDISFNSFLEEITDGLTALVPNHVLTVQTGQEAIIFMDQLRIEQVLQNLIVNAAKYSEPGTNIYLRTALRGDQLLVEVEDEGIGMDEKIFPDIFNKFYRNENVQQKYHGLGMGLFVTSKIVADHHGTIEVISAVGKGSRFSVLIPFVR